MNATELYLADGKATGIFFCGKCRTVHRAKELAEQCCANYACSDCGKDTGGRSWLICDSCRLKRDDAKERQRFEKAEKVTSFDGFVYSDGHGYRDGYFESLEDFYTWLEDESANDGEIPAIEYVWACTPKSFVNVDVGDIIGSFESDAYEDWDSSDLNGVDELKAALTKFIEANREHISYEPDFTKAVLIDPKRCGLKAA